MQDYFGSISPDGYRFFVEPGNENMERRNPLEGSYPYGSTGKTLEDPLVGFLHCKYSKRGKPTVRIVKPGKYSPRLANEAQSTPYQEKGSLMRRGASGRYRHIASYSMAELIELGWDGAKYNSKTISGQWVPFVPGYDSDEDDKYEPIDVQAGKQAGIIGLLPEEGGLYMTIIGGDGNRRLIQLNVGH